uniref:Uncharacterized protein n=1 Tax=Anopheles quadriannulatus TaxID=34691 RepID=A0A182XTV0_ANOQN
MPVLVPRKANWFLCAFVCFFLFGIEYFITTAELLICFFCVCLAAISLNLTKTQPDDDDEQRAQNARTVVAVTSCPNKAKHNTTAPQKDKVISCLIGRSHPPPQAASTRTRIRTYGQYLQDRQHKSFIPGWMLLVGI